MLCDTGPLVALVDSSDADHAICQSIISRLESPLLTTWPCFTEAMYLVGRRHGFAKQRELWRLIQIGAVEFHAVTKPEPRRMRHHMQKYQNVPMDLADASLVVAAETLNLTRIFTLDADFRIYRIRDTIPFEIVP